MSEPALLDRAPALGAHELLEAAADALPTHPALVCGRLRLNWGELAERTGAGAASLAAAGIAPGDAVAVLLPGGTDLVLALLALLRLGAVAVPLDPAFTRAEVAFCARESGARAVIADEHGAALAPAALRRLTPDALTHRGDGHAPTPPAPDADAIVLFSSGCTGRPKRVPRTHRQLAAEAASVAGTMRITPEDTIVAGAPLWHAYGLGTCLMAALAGGAALALPERVPLPLARRAVLRALTDAPAAVFATVPYGLRTLAEAPAAALGRVRLCFTAGNALPRAVFDAFASRHGIGPRQLYGCTETGAATANLDRDPWAAVASVGTPLAGVAVTVVGADGQPVEAGRIGEVVISSPAMTAGYAGVSDAVNREAFPGRAFLTGDRGRIDAAGRLHLTGRRKLLIDVRGNKVDPIEVEDVLAVHPRVREVVVLGVPSDVDGEEMVKTVVVPDGRCGERELVRFCRERLAGYKVPQVVEFRDEIPRSPVGKVLRKYLV
jgi:long-chain acyl-CoA synthetase